MNSRAPGVPPWTLLTASADHHIGLCGRLLLTVWFGETRIAALRAMEQAIRASAAAAPDGRVGLVVVVEPSAIAPSPAARDELARIRGTNPIAMTALILEGTGFHAAMVRGITMSLNLLEPAETRTHVFANVAAVGAWLEGYHPRMTPKEISGEVRERARS